MCTSPERTRPFSWCSIGLENDTSHARYRYITNATLDIISQCAFGQDVHAQSPDGEQQPAYVQAVNEQTELIFDRVLKPWYVRAPCHHGLLAVPCVAVRLPTSPQPGCTRTESTTI